MYKTCKTTKSKLRQREIEQALISLMASTPFADVSVTALCAHLDMPRKSFYRYFDAKEDVLDAFMDHLLEECDAITLSDATLRQRVEQLLFFAKRKKDLLDILSKNDLLRTLVIRACTRSFSDEDALAKILPNEPQWVRPMIARFTTAGFATLVLDWYKDDFARPVGEMTDICCRMLARPLLNFPANT
jgi:AcrR family transcriptional regulator